MHPRRGLDHASDHDRRDIVLEPGERFRSDSHRRALVAALEPSCVRFSAAALSVAARPGAGRGGRLGDSWAHGMTPA